MSTKMLTRAFTLALLVASLYATSVAAQDRPVRRRAMDRDTTARQERLEARQERFAAVRSAAGRRTVAALAQRLELDARQANALRVAVEGADDAGNAGWRIAAVLQKELSEAQKTKLFTMAERATAYRAGRQAGLADARALAGRRLAVREEARRGTGHRSFAGRSQTGRVAAADAFAGRSARRAANGAVRNNGTGRPGRAGAMADALGLTDSQKELMRLHRAIASIAVSRAQAPGARARISSR